MVELFAKNGDPDRTLRSAAPDLCLHCLPAIRLRVSSLQRIKVFISKFPVLREFSVCCLFLFIEFSIFILIICNYPSSNQNIFLRFCSSGLQFPLAK